MSLHVTLTPAGANTRHLLPTTDPGTGIVTVTARPTRQGWAVSQDLLAALGVNLDVYGRGRRHAEDLQLAEAWMVAHDVRLLIVRHADNITPYPDILASLHTLTETIDGTLVLTCEEPGDPRLADWVHDRGGTILAWDDLQVLMQRQTRPVEPVAEDQDPDFPQFLPRVDFYLFRARCRDTLTPAQHQAVDALYRDAFRVTRAAGLTDAEETAAFLGDLLAQHRTPGEALTIVRAAQAALFTQGQHLKVEVQTLLMKVAEHKHRRFTRTEVRALRAYRHPSYACIGVLYDANLSNQDMDRLRIDNINADGTLTGIEHLPLLPDARTYLRAYRHLRLLDGAKATDPFFGRGEVHRSLVLRRIGVDLNLPTVGNHERRHQRKQDRWRHTLGVSVQPLIIRKRKTSTTPRPAGAAA